jgi:hypothetical protein
MVKLKFKGCLTLGITRRELQEFTAGRPIIVELEDVGLKGQRILLIPGEDDQQLYRIMSEAATVIEQNGNVIEIAQTLEHLKRTKN